MHAVPNYDQWQPLSALPGSNVGPVLTAAATIAPSYHCHHITGTTEISTITPPYTGFKGYFLAIADSAFTTSTGGNIGEVLTADAGESVLFFYDGATWYPIGHA